MSLDIQNEIINPENKEIISNLNKRNIGIQSINKSKDEIKKTTLSNLGDIKIQIIKLPQILTQSTEPNHNKKIIKLKKKIIKEKEDNNKEKFLITGVENKLTGTDDLGIGDYNNNNNEKNDESKKDNNKLYDVNELLFKENERYDVEKIKNKLNIGIPLKSGSYFLNKMNLRKKPKNIEKVENKRFLHSLNFLKKMTNCYLDYEKKIVVNDFQNNNKRLQRIRNDIYNTFDNMRVKTEVQFENLLNKEDIEF